ncbi:type II toxin-antitoxin system PemK/MazF family toxin [Candidatus Woesearchaeota archaeon]|jgi:mRNA interferase MazF|nr:type II toxin-antitoxin system PemK/MazF family toxin [Candidatus Woesearchaeota archaeon]MBT4321825.1 type II toxin-antitoxin system PemK/MazF family toxin [Candidatus Woesearchaeota archaeon]
MTSGTQFKQKDILIIPLPFTDLTTIKQRPVLIVSNDTYNFNTEDFIVCGITSNLKDARCSVLIESKNLIEGKLPTTSRIKVDKIINLNKSLVKKKIGVLDDKTFEKVKKELEKLF